MNLQSNKNDNWNEFFFQDLTSDGANSLTIPPTSLLPTVRYEKMMNLFNLDTGRLCRSVPEIRSAFRAALDDKTKPHFLNIMINPMATRKAQSFDWLTRSKM